MSDPPADFGSVSIVRKIIHVDMDAFYASVEQRDDPQLRGKPIVVGGRPGGRGVVAAASYEARKFGIRSAMSSSHAYRLCPEAIFVRPRFDAYRAASAQIMEIFHRYTELVEPLSLDEAYLDVTENKLAIPLARDIARAIKDSIREETGLSASAGVAPNKFLAKIASDFRKPDGLTVIPPERVEAFLIDLPIRKFPGVGPVTEQKFASFGILTNRHLRKWALEDLEKHFGKSGRWFYRISRGIDDRVVSSDHERKSLGAEDTFSKDLTEPAEMEQELRKIAEKVAGRLEKRGLEGRTVTLKATYADFEKITRSRTLAQPVSSADDLFALAVELLQLTEAGPEKPVRLLGLQLSNFPVLQEEEMTFPHQLPFEFGE